MIEAFLKSRGFSLAPRGNEKQAGFCTKAQLEQFSKQLAKYPQIKKIAEIGLNAGHSAEHFFQQCKELQFFVSFDLNFYPYTAHAVEYFNKLHKDRFLFIQGDSIETVPQLHQKHPQLKFDLIYIDGMHHFKWVVADIINSKELAAENTVLWLDDFDPENGVGAAVKFCETFGLIKVEEQFVSEDPKFGKRCWLEARFTRYTERG